MKLSQSAEIETVTVHIVYAGPKTGMTSQKRDLVRDTNALTCNKYLRDRNCVDFTLVFHSNATNQQNVALNAWKHLLLWKTALSELMCRTSLWWLPISSIHPHAAYINGYAIQSRQHDSAFVCQGRLSGVYACCEGLQVGISCLNLGLAECGGCESTLTVQTKLEDSI